jgi:heme exporter protein B
MSLTRRVAAIVGKDVLAELRSKEHVTAMFFFAFLVLMIFAFALGPDRLKLQEASPGLLWVAFVFMGVLALAKSVEMERQNDCLDGLLLFPGGREAIYIGKLVGNVCFMLTVELVVFPLFAVLYNLEIWRAFPALLLVGLLGTIGFAAVGTVFSAMTTNLRAREVMLPLLLLPVEIPVILASVKSTEAILKAQPWSEAAPWLQLLGVFDVIYVVVGILVFEYIVEE